MRWGRFQKLLSTHAPAADVLGEDPFKWAYPRVRAALDMIFGRGGYDTDQTVSDGRKLITFHNAPGTGTAAEPANLADPAPDDEPPF